MKGQKEQIKREILERKYQAVCWEQGLDEALSDKCREGERVNKVIGTQWSPNLPLLIIILEINVNCYKSKIKYAYDVLREGCNIKKQNILREREWMWTHCFSITFPRMIKAFHMDIHVCTSLIFNIQ